MQLQKHIAVLAAAVITLSAVYGQQFSLLGHIDGQTAGYVHLSYPDEGGQRVNDSAILKNGNFHFTGNIPCPVMAYFRGGGASGYDDDPNNTSFFLEPASMHFSGKAGHLKDAVIIGSKTQDEYQQLNKDMRPVMEEMKPLSKAYEAANQTYIDAVKDKKDDKTQAALKEKAVALHDAFDPYDKKIAAISYRFFAAHPHSYVTAYELRGFTGSLAMDSLQMFYNNLGTATQQSLYGKDLAKEIEKIRAGSPGSMAANFTATDINGKPISLSDFKGKYVILDFWASWCVPCRKSNPHMIELYKKYHSKGFAIIGVADDDNNHAAWRKAVTHDGVGIWHNVLRGFSMGMLEEGIPNKKDISEKFGITALPTKIVIDPSGKIIGRFVGDDTGLDKKLEEAFGS